MRNTLKKEEDKLKNQITESNNCAWLGLWWVFDFWSTAAAALVEKQEAERAKCLALGGGVRVNVTFISPDEWLKKKVENTVEAAAATLPLLLSFLWQRAEKRRNERRVAWKALQLNGVGAVPTEQAQQKMVY